MSSTIFEIVKEVLPVIIICLVVISTLRITYFIKTKAKPNIISETFALIFIAYIMCLFYVVTFQDIDASWSASNFIPFQEMFRYEFGSRLFIKNVLGNMLMFIPFGFFSSYFLKEKKVLVIFVITVIVSLAIEFTQLKIGRVFDIDDILLNIVGGVIGYYLYRLFFKILSNF
jgi:Glycopeptide antibiotics resistance protein